MKTIIQFSRREELKALPILLRRTSGMNLPGRRYVIDVAAAEALRRAGMRFKTLTSESSINLHGARKV